MQIVMSCCETRCRAAEVLLQCVRTHEVSCSGSLLMAFNATLDAVFGVINSLSVCNPSTPCHINKAINCVESLVVSITAASGYSPPTSYDGSIQDGFCRRLDDSTAVTCGCRSSDPTRQPQICETYGFYWGSICM
jgi:hypothetical protein